MEHKHDWQVEHLLSQFPRATAGTAQAVEYAYLLCSDCMTVKKVRVEEDE